MNSSMAVTLGVPRPVTGSQPLSAETKPSLQPPLLLVDRLPILRKVAGALRAIS